MAKKPKNSYAAKRHCLSILLSAKLSSKLNCEIPYCPLHLKNKNFGTAEKKKLLKLHKGQKIKMCGTSFLRSFMTLKVSARGVLWSGACKYIKSTLSTCRRFRQPSTCKDRVSQRGQFCLFRVNFNPLVSRGWINNQLFIINEI